jgi:hypothetical protein
MANANQAKEKNDEVEDGVIEEMSRAVSSEDARDTISRIARKEICAEEVCAGEITAEMIDVGAYLLSESYSQPRDWLTCQRAAEIYAAMRSLEYAKRN